MKAVIFLISLFLVGCGKFPDGTSVWQGGLWIIPTITAIGAVIFLISGIRSSKSGSWYWDKGSQRRVDTDENISLYKLWQFWFFVVLTIATIGIIILVNSER